MTSILIIFVLFWLYNIITFCLFWNKSSKFRVLFRFLIDFNNNNVVFMGLIIPTINSSIPIRSASLVGNSLYSVSSTNRKLSLFSANFWFDFTDLHRIYSFFYPFSVSTFSLQEQLSLIYSIFIFLIPWLDLLLWIACQVSLHSISTLSIVHCLVIIVVCYENNLYVLSSIMLHKLV